MRRAAHSFLFFLPFLSLTLFGQDGAFINPDIRGKGWRNLFKDDLTNAIYPKGVWVVENKVLTALEDEVIWSEKSYDDFILDLEFKNVEGTNSGVIVHASDLKDWIPNSVEIQIADDYAEKWAKSPASWQCAAIFGHQPALKRLVKQPNEWNRYTITCRDKKIWVVLNGELVNTCDMNLYTTANNNIDGTTPPAWLSKAMATIPLRGHIGLQGKHAGAPIYFRNIKIKEL
jgi:hypothetical protein